MGDLNGDGKADLVITHIGNNEVSYGIGDGAGVFTFTTLSITMTLPRTVEVADMNRDGKADIIMGGSNTQILHYTLPLLTSSVTSLSNFSATHLAPSASQNFTVRSEEHTSEL